MFENLKQPTSVNSYQDFKGVTDFSNLQQYNLYESGYSFLVICKIPKFLELLATNEKYSNLINTYKHILEYEFRGLDGLENLQRDPSEITDGITNYEMHTKTTMQGSSAFTMKYYERSGSVITRVHELFLRGIKDPRTQLKTYNGLIENGQIALDEVGYDKETFSFLYINTDNTGRQVERAVYIVGAQPTTSELSIYETEKGSIEFKEVNVEMNGFPIYSDAVDMAAKKYLGWLFNPSNSNRVIADSYNFKYNALANETVKDASGKETVIDTRNNSQV